MVDTFSFKRLVLRAPLRQVSPEVSRLVLVSDRMELLEFHDASLIWQNESQQGLKPAN
jgi:hypothetical protein